MEQIVNYILHFGWSPPWHETNILAYLLTKHSCQRRNSLLTKRCSQRRKYPNATWQAMCPTDLKQACQHTSCSKFSVKQRQHMSGYNLKQMISCKHVPNRPSLHVSIPPAVSFQLSSANTCQDTAWNRWFLLTRTFCLTESHFHATDTVPRQAIPRPPTWQNHCESKKQFFSCNCAASRIPKFLLDKAGTAPTPASRTLQPGKSKEYLFHQCCNYLLTVAWHISKTNPSRSGQIQRHQTHPHICQLRLQNRTRHNWRGSKQIQPNKHLSHFERLRHPGQRSANRPGQNR